MKMVGKGKESEVKVITGNAAAAYGAMLCQPDVVATYPITPQTEVIEKLFEFHAEGLLDAEMIPVEGENSAMNAVTAAAMAGARVFTATSSWGLAFMYDAMLAASGARAPVVMVNVNRETPGIIAVSCGQQDMISTRDSGWIILIAESCQEILDQVIMAYRLAEDFDVQLPVMVNYDGFYLSYYAEKVEIPTKEDVAEFLTPLRNQPQRPVLLPGKSLGCGTHGILEGYVELRYKHVRAINRAKKKFDEIDRAFSECFGRGYGGQVEEYFTEDADVVLVGSGSMSGTIKKVIDMRRKDGEKIGYLRIRMYRPFPKEKLIKCLKGKKAVGVVDRSVCFGYDGGPIYNEIKSLCPDLADVPILSFIDGLANTDVTVDHVNRMVEEVYKASSGQDYKKVVWFFIDE